MADRVTRPLSDPDANRTTAEASRLSAIADEHVEPVALNLWSGIQHRVHAIASASVFNVDDRPERQHRGISRNNALVNVYASGRGRAVAVRRRDKRHRVWRNRIRRGRCLRSGSRRPMGRASFDTDHQHAKDRQTDRERTGHGLTGISSPESAIRLLRRVPVPMVRQPQWSTCGPKALAPAVPARSPSDQRVGRRAAGPSESGCEAEFESLRHGTAIAATLSNCMAWHRTTSRGGCCAGRDRSDDWSD